MLDSNKQQAFTKPSSTTTSSLMGFKHHFGLFSLLERASLWRKIQISYSKKLQNMQQRNKKLYSLNCYCWESLNSNGLYLTLIHLFIHAKRVRFNSLSVLFIRRRQFVCIKEHMNQTEQHSIQNNRQEHSMQNNMHTKTGWEKRSTWITRATKAWRLWFNSKT